MIRNSIGSKIFRNLFADIDGVEIDVVGNGDKSCALFVSSVLYINKMIGDIHATVLSTTKDLQANGWTEINTPREGAILEWESLIFDDGSSHSHLGFYIGNEQAISNGSNISDGVPIEHHFTYNNTRKIIRIWWHDKLEGL